MIHQQLSTFHSPSSELAHISIGHVKRYTHPWNFLMCRFSKFNAYTIYHLSWLSTTPRTMSFLTLPREIRDLVYHHMWADAVFQTVYQGRFGTYLIFAYYDNLEPPGYDPSVGLPLWLLTSQQLWKEGMERIYRRAGFRMICRQTSDRPFSALLHMDHARNLRLLFSPHNGNLHRPDFMHELHDVAFLRENRGIKLQLEVEEVHTMPFDCAVRNGTGRVVFLIITEHFYLIDGLISRHSFTSFKK
jgi:hypothetical protein